MDIAQEIWVPLNDDPDLLRKVIIDYHMAMTLKPYHLNRSQGQNSQDGKSASNSVKCEGFGHCFFHRTSDACKWIFGSKKSHNYASPLEAMDLDCLSKNISISGLSDEAGQCSMYWVLKNAVVWADVWELELSWWRVIRFRRLVFLIS